MTPELKEHSLLVDASRNAKTAAAKVLNQHHIRQAEYFQAG
jgi:hypothetical protein